MKIIKVLRYIPIPVRVVLAFGCLSAVVHLLCRFFTPFADFIDQYPATWLRSAMAYTTGWFPLSFAEILILLIPLWIFLIVFLLIKCSASRVLMFKAVATLLAIVLGIYGLFVFTLGCGYCTTTLDKKIDLPRETPSAEALHETAEWLIESTKAEEKKMKYAESGSSIMPMPLSQVNESLIDSYSQVSEKYGFLHRVYSRVKPVMLSKPMTYTNITGVYFFITGEANINVNYPDYIIPFTAAHELAHQRGISRENEANFVAFLVCMESEESYVRYSGYMNMTQYVMNALYRADKELWQAAWDQMSDGMRGELYAFNEFYDAYQGTVIDEISNAINDNYLVANGTEGVASYGLVVDLTVAYYKEMQNPQ